MPDAVDGPAAEKEDTLPITFDILPFEPGVTIEDTLTIGDAATVPVRDFTVAGGEEGTAYTYRDGVLTVLGGDLTVSMQAGAPASAQRIQVAKGYTGTLHLDNLHIDQGVGGGGALTLESGANVNMKLT